MPGKYATETKVPVSQTRHEIEGILGKYGADQFAYGSREEPRGAAIGFRYAGRQYRFLLPLPVAKDFKTKDQFEQAERSHWRALFLIVKAKLEAVEREVSSFEQEFLAYTLLADGRTLHEEVEPSIRQIYETGKVLPLLGHLTALPEGNKR
jgi:hypothetical protein